MKGFIKFIEGSIESQNEISEKFQSLLNQIAFQARKPNPNFKGKKKEINSDEEPDFDFLDFEPEEIIDYNHAKQKGYFYNRDNHGNFLTIETPGFTGKRILNKEFGSDFSGQLQEWIIEAK